MFKTEADAQDVLDRYRRLGVEAGVPLSNHLAYGVVAPISEWESTVGSPSAVRENEQIHAEVEVEVLQVRAREAIAALEQARERLTASRPAPRTSSSDWIGVPGEKGIQQRTRSNGTTVYRHRGGQTVDSLGEAVRDRDRQPFDREALDRVIAEAEA